jgi:hypothetical protein
LVRKQHAAQQGAIEGKALTVKQQAKLKCYEKNVGFGHEV